MHSGANQLFLGQVKTIVKKGLYQEKKKITGIEELFRKLDLTFNI